MSDNLKKIQPHRIEGSGQSGKLIAVNELGVVEATDTIKGSLTISGDLVPASSNQYNLGSSSIPFKDIHLSTGTIRTYDQFGVMRSSESQNNNGVFINTYGRQVEVDFAIPESSNGFISAISVVPKSLSEMNSKANHSWDSIPEIKIVRHPNDTLGYGATASVDGLDSNGGITSITVNNGGQFYSSPTFGVWGDDGPPTLLVREPEETDSQWSSRTEPRHTTKVNVGNGVDNNGNDKPATEITIDEEEIYVKPPGGSRRRVTTQPVEVDCNASPPNGIVPYYSGCKVDYTNIKYNNTNNNTYFGKHIFTSGDVTASGKLFIKTIDQDDSINKVLAISGDGEVVYRDASTLLSSSSAGGSNKSIQFNKNGTLSGDTDFFYDYDNSVFYLKENTVTGIFNANSTANIFQLGTYSNHSLEFHTNNTFCGGFSNNGRFYINNVDQNNSLDRILVHNTSTDEIEYRSVSTITSSAGAGGNTSTIQFNNGGALSGDDNFYYDDANNTVKLTESNISYDVTGFLNPSATDNSLHLGTSSTSRLNFYTSNVYCGSFSSGGNFFLNHIDQDNSLDRILVQDTGTKEIKYKSASSLGGGSTLGANGDTAQGDMSYSSTTYSPFADTSITPSSTTHRVLINGNINVSVPADQLNGMDGACYAQLFRGTTPLGRRKQIVNNNQTATGFVAVGGLSFTLLDYPATTSHTEYSVKLKSIDGGYGAQTITVHDAQITVQEISPL